MIDNADLILLFLVAVVLAVGVICAHVALRMDAGRVQKYRLYRVRDEFIYLVASGKLREDEFLFQEFYKSINHFISYTDSITFGTFVRAIQSARQNGLDPATDEKVLRLRKELRLKDQAVNDVVGGFFKAMLDILVENSLLLRILVTVQASTGRGMSNI